MSPRVAVVAVVLLLSAPASLAGMAEGGVGLGHTQTPSLTTTAANFPKYARGADASASSFGTNNTSGSITVSGTLTRVTYATVLWLNATSASSLRVNITAAGAITNGGQVSYFGVDIVTSSGTTRQLQAGSGGTYSQSGGSYVTVPAGGWMRIQIEQQRANVIVTPTAPVKVNIYDTAGNTRGGSLDLTFRF